MTSVIKGGIFRQDQFNYDGVDKNATRKDSTGGTVTGLKVGWEVDVLAAYGKFESYTRQTIVDCVNRIGSASATLVFNPGTWVIDDNLTIASNFACHIPSGCVFQVASGKTLTFSGPVYRDSNTWTSGSGTVTEGGTKYIVGKLDLTGAVLQGGTPLVFEGATDNAFETSVVITEPTADRTITFPDANVDLSSVPTANGPNSFTGINTFAGAVTFSSTVAITGVLTTGLTFEGATADANETTLAITDPTADRTVTVPDQSGTILLVPSSASASQVFTATGTFNVPAAINMVWLTGTAAGGGGGDSNGGTGKGGSGGGAGEWCVRKPVIVTPGAAITVTLGAVGAASSGTGSSNGGDAVDTTFDSLLTLDGGHGGLAGGGTRGAGGTGNGHFPGARGGLGAQGGGASSGGPGGNGGTFITAPDGSANGPTAALSFGLFGKGGDAPAATTAGAVGVGYGSGGSGGSGGNSAGGAGAPAYLIVEY